MANAILSHLPLTPSSRRGLSHEPWQKNPYHFLTEYDTDFNIPSRLDPREKRYSRCALMLFKIPPPPGPSPKGGELLLPFTFAPLPPLARERCRVRSLGTCAGRELSGETLTVSPEPFSEVRLAHSRSPHRGPLDRVPYAQTVHRTVWATLLIFFRI